MAVVAEKEQADIDNGIVNSVVGFAPLKPAEVVIRKEAPPY